MAFKILVYFACDICKHFSLFLNFLDFFIQNISVYVYFKGKISNFVSIQLPKLVLGYVYAASAATPSLLTNFAVIEPFIIIIINP